VTAAVLWVAALLTTNTGHHLRDGVAAGVAAIACAALVLRRRWPYPALLISTIAAEAYLARVAGGGGTLILAAPLLALYTVAETGPRRRSLTVAVALVLLIGVFHTMAKSGAWLGAENVALAALGGLAVAAGEASRNRRALLRERVVAERLRIARDLHDSVGHHLALINVQAGVAGHVLTDRSGPLADTLEQIRQSSRSALDELRDAVGLLRDADEPALLLDPSAGLDDLLSDCGLRITCHGRSLVDRLPPAVDAVVYRVVQESLTNVRKHAGPAAVRLVFGRVGDALTVLVENDGPAVLPVAEGHGLTGMRERVTALGGSLVTGPVPAGGFRVTARLPIGGIA
jgi:signal transduction histidine kinase